MKAGDLVRLKKAPTKIGVAMEFIQKKCWRTDKLGPMVDWRKIDPEPHVVVFFSQCSQRAIPTIDLEVVSAVD